MCRVAHLIETFACHVSSARPKLQYGGYVVPDVELHYVLGSNHSNTVAKGGREDEVYQPSHSVPPSEKRRIWKFIGFPQS